VLKDPYINFSKFHLDLLLRDLHQIQVIVFIFVKHIEEYVRSLSYFPNSEPHKDYLLCLLCKFPIVLQVLDMLTSSSGTTNRYHSCKAAMV
jgi:hypothetical protein